MFYSTELITPLGTVTLASDGDALCGLWFHGQKYFAASISGAMHQKDGLEIFRETKNGRRSENCRCVRLDRNSDRTFGRFCVRFRMGK